jgi:hypothetical protein
LTIDAGFISGSSGPKYRPTIAAYNNVQGGNAKGAATAIMVRNGSDSNVSAIDFGVPVSLYALSSANGSGDHSGACAVGESGGKGSGTITAQGMVVSFAGDSTLSVSSSGAYSGASALGVGGGNVESALANGVEADFGVGSKLSLFSLGNYSSVSVVGAASYNERIAGIAHDVAVNFDGSQTISTLAYGIDGTKINAFGADNTDSVNGYGWRVGIRADTTISSSFTVNILAAKLGNAMTVNGGKATIKLGIDQGNSSNDYARAFALGKDYRIYFGGKVDKTKALTSSSDNCGFEAVEPAAETTNVVNVFGAISKGKNSTVEAKNTV